MNDYSSTENQEGLLKNIYDPDKLTAEALKRKRKKLAETKLGITEEDENGSMDS